ncbi:MAG: T9SS type A sorting domain-containing protein [Cryomorphaceae bacterium]|nr:T9SS type A sorting domain-containing protein [Cryomorphaceae bacterium]
MQSVLSFLLIVLISSFALHSKAQEVIFGTNNYIEYQVGTLPLVISVPHGGDLDPASIPDRTCNDPVYATDAFTIETALEIKNALFSATGCYPHIVISHLERAKLDPNRNVADGACENPEAMAAWTEFHGFIADAREAVNQQYDSQTFFVDLHGHGNPIQRIELGYLLYDDELELSDNTLNTAQYINYSSIQNLALNNVNNYTHAQLLRGPFAFGTFLSNLNYPAVPSESIPSPGTTTNYFSGGYITANHTCYNPSAPINGLQMELNYGNVRDTPANRSAFALAFTQSVIGYMDKHFNLSWGACEPVSVNESANSERNLVYPNPATKGSLIHFDLPSDSSYLYRIVNVFGQSVSSGELNAQHTLQSEAFPSGVYIVEIVNESQVVSTKKLVIE